MNMIFGETTNRPIEACLWGHSSRKLDVKISLCGENERLRNSKLLSRKNVLQRNLSHKGNRKGFAVFANSDVGNVSNSQT